MIDIIEATIAQAAAYLLNFVWLSPPPPPPSIDALTIFLPVRSYPLKQERRASKNIIK